MAEHEASRTIPADPGAVFEVASDVDRLPRWLPTAQEASSPGPGLVHVEGEAGGAHYADDGLWRVSPEQRRVEWSQPSRGGEPATYAGWLQVADSGAGGSEVTVHLSFLAPEGRSADPASRSEQAADAGLAEALAALERLVTG